MTAPHDVDPGFLPPPDFVPHTQMPTWQVLTPLSPQARAAHDFMWAHVDQSTGEFLAIPSMTKIAKFLGMKTDNGARKYVTELKKAGLVSSVETYWDRKAQRRTTKRVRDDGVKNDQTSNTFQLRWQPSKGRMHPGPLTTKEWHHPEQIQERLEKEAVRNGIAAPTPPHTCEGGSDQGKQAPPRTAVKGAPSQLLGDPPHTCEDEEQPGEKNQTNQTNDAANSGCPEDSGVGCGNGSKRKARKPRTGTAGTHPKDGDAAKKLRDIAHSRTAGNADATSDDDEAAGFPDGRESGSDQDVPNLTSHRAQRYLATVAFPDNTGFAEHAQRDTELVAHVTSLLDSDWTEDEITQRITESEGTKVKSWGGFARRKLMTLRPKPKNKRNTGDQSAHGEVDRLLGRGDRGAREAASILGMTWTEPDRGDMDAKTYLIDVLPAAAREFIETHRDELVTAMTSRNKNVA